MLYRVKFTLFVFLVLGLISGCTGPAPTVPAVPEPTLPPPTPATAQSLADPAEVVQGFWDALKAKDLDTAMTFVADDVQLRGRGFVNGKEALQNFLQGWLGAGYSLEIHDLQVDGDTVNYLVDYSREGFIHAKDAKDVMRIQNGKIIYWELG
jgi:ketosteroid isomerase-like protein